MGRRGKTSRSLPFVIENRTIIGMGLDEFLSDIKTEHDITISLSNKCHTFLIISRFSNLLPSIALHLEILNHEDAKVKKMACRFGCDDDDYISALLPLESDNTKPNCHAREDYLQIMYCPEVSHMKTLRCALLSILRSKQAILQAVCQARIWVLND